jgi:hypothetical protein
MTTFALLNASAQPYFESACDQLVGFIHTFKNTMKQLMNINQPMEVFCDFSIQRLDDKNCAKCVFHRCHA